MTRYTDLPELSGVRLRTITSWYDGPLAGLAVHGDQTYWYQARPLEPADENNPGEYILYPLSHEELSAEVQRHEAFRELVGTHWDLGTHGQRVAGKVRNDKAAFDLYYKTYPPRREPYGDRPGIGRFRLADGALGPSRVTSTDAD